MIDTGNRFVSPEQKRATQKWTSLFFFQLVFDPADIILRQARQFHYLKNAAKDDGYIIWKAFEKSLKNWKIKSHEN